MIHWKPEVGMGLDDKNSGSKVKNLSVPVFLGPLTTTKQEIGSIGLKSQIWISASMKCTGRNIRFVFKIGAGIAWHLCQSLNAILATVITIFIQFGPFFCMGSASCFESLLSLFCWWPLLGQVAIWPPNWPQIWKSMQVCHVGYQSRAHDTLDWFKLFGHLAQNDHQRLLRGLSIAYINKAIKSSRLIPHICRQFGCH